MRFVAALSFGLCGLILVSAAPTAPPKVEDEVGAAEKGPAVGVPAEDAPVHPVAVLMDNGDVVPIPAVSPDVVDGADFVPMDYPYMGDPMMMEYDQYGQSVPYPVGDYNEDVGGDFAAVEDGESSAPTRNMTGRRYYGGKWGGKYYGGGGYVPAYTYGATYATTLGPRQPWINKPIINKPIFNKPIVNKPIINRPIFNKRRFVQTVPIVQPVPEIPAYPVQPELPSFPMVPTLPEFPTTLPSYQPEPEYSVEPAFTYPRFDADVNGPCPPGENCGTVTGMYVPRRTVVSDAAVVSSGPLRKSVFPKRYVA